MYWMKLFIMLLYNAFYFSKVSTNVFSFIFKSGNMSFSLFSSLFYHPIAVLFVSFFAVISKCLLFSLLIYSLTHWLFSTVLISTYLWFFLNCFSGTNFYFHSILIEEDILFFNPFVLFQPF